MGMKELLSDAVSNALEILQRSDWRNPEDFLKLVGAAALTIVAYRLFSFFVGTLAFVFQPQPPKVVVEILEDEANDVLTNKRKFDTALLKGETKTVYMWDPSTMDYLGERPAMGESEVREIVARSRVAQAEWQNSSFSQRRLLMRTLQRYITENQETCARVSVRDSGKTMLDALIGDVLTTCEKLAWLADHGEQYLLPEKRAAGRTLRHKSVHVEWTPMGVIGAIVPWNYPFHNVFNPVSAALFSGNSIGKSLTACNTNANRNHTATLFSAFLTPF
jgi:hypothetical protein